MRDPFALHGPVFQTFLNVWTWWGDNLHRVAVRLSWLFHGMESFNCVKIQVNFSCGLKNTWLPHTDTFLSTLETLNCSIDPFDCAGYFDTYVLIHPNGFSQCWKGNGQHFRMSTLLFGQLKWLQFFCKRTQIMQQQQVNFSRFYQVIPVVSLNSEFPPNRVQSQMRSAAICDEMDKGQIRPIFSYAPPKYSVVFAPSFPGKKSWKMEHLTGTGTGYDSDCLSGT